MGWLVFLGILTVLALLPLGAYLCYDAEGFAASLVIGPVRWTLYPIKKNGKKKDQPQDKRERKTGKDQKTADKTETAQPDKADEPAEAEQKGGKLTDFIPFVKLGLDLLGDFRRKLRVNDLYLRLIMAGGDPAKLAIHYGRAWAALGNLMPRVERVLKIKKRDIQVGCDFTGSETTVIFHMDVTVTLGALLTLTVIYGVRAVKEYLNFKNKRKGGAAK